MISSQKIVLFLIKTLCRVFMSWEVHGVENVPEEGSLILIANHVHAMEVILLPVVFPRWINYMAKQELFTYPILSSFIRWAGAFPVIRQGVVADRRDTLSHALSILEQGKVLGMFPEGKRSGDGVLLRGKAGPVVLANEAGVQLIPAAVTGLDKLYGIRELLKRPHVVIKIGKPFMLPTVKHRLKRSEMKLLTEQMMMKIAVMLPEDKRGVYGSS